MSTIPAHMSALVWLGPKQMELQRVPVPVPADGDVLIHIGAVGICGSELSGYLGESSIRFPPLIMGHEGAGTIVAGHGRLYDGTPAQIGQRVTFNPLVSCGQCDRCQRGLEHLCRSRKLLSAHLPGAFAEYMIIPANLCWALPDHVSDIAGSLCEPLACTVHAVRLAQPSPESVVLILGAGPIGLCAIAAAKARGVRTIISSDIADNRLAVAREWGATHTINARSDDTVKATRALFPGGVDVVIDAVGTSAVRNQGIMATAPGGTVVLMGLHEDETAIPTNYVIRQEISLLGCFCYTQHDFATAVELVGQGIAQPASNWLIERPLSAGDMSFKELLAGTAPVTKIVLRP